MTRILGTMRTLTARKDHICEQCEKTISAGSRYVKCANITDCGFYVYKAHEDCEEVVNKIWDNGDLLYGDSINLAMDDLSDDADWICADYPDVATRLGLARREAE